MRCVVSKHGVAPWAVADKVYLGNSLCDHHFSSAVRFVNSCKKPDKVSSYSVIDVLEAQSSPA